jgi:hypothetical protein
MKSGAAIRKLPREPRRNCPKLIVPSWPTETPHVLSS